MRVPVAGLVPWALAALTLAWTLAACNPAVDPGRAPASAKTGGNSLLDSDGLSPEDSSRLDVAQDLLSTFRAFDGSTPEGDRLVELSRYLPSGLDFSCQGDPNDVCVTIDLREGGRSHVLELHRESDAPARRVVQFAEPRGPHGLVARGLAEGLGQDDIDQMALGHLVGRRLFAKACGWVESAEPGAGREQESPVAPVEWERVWSGFAATLHAQIRGADGLAVVDTSRLEVQNEAGDATLVVMNGPRVVFEMLFQRPASGKGCKATFVYPPQI